MNSIFTEENLLAFTTAARFGSFSKAAEELGLTTSAISYFGFRTGFQSQRLAGMDQRFNHATVLVNLNRVDKEVIAIITVRFTRAFEGGVDRAQAVLQDLREAEQRRQTLPLRLAGFD